jgi:VIT1/CCC1 family predicted Fe2+/Mn2+ transporter
MRSPALYLRTIVFGVIDALVSNVGLLAGMDAAHTPHHTIALTGIIYAFVEGFSMAVGNFLSEESVEEYVAKKEVGQRSALGAGVMMFIVSVLAAFIPIFPYMLFEDWKALALSVVLSILSLFIVGTVSGKIAKLPMVTRGVRMMLLGGAAIVIGIVVGVVIPA